MSYLADGERRFGPITYGRASWSPLRLVLSSGDTENDVEQNTLTAYAFGWVARINLPTLIKHFSVRHKATYWDAETIKRLGRDWYSESFPREYGFSYSDGFLQIFLGAQTHDSDTTKSWSKFLPWTQWRFLRHSFYDDKGCVFWSKRRGDMKYFISHGYDEEYAAEKACPSVSFMVEDYDGAQITAKTIIEQREWKFGDGWFKWLSLFRKDMVRKSLKINFSAETGPEKGSWKGGTTGCSIDMLPGELHESAMRRYCDQEQRSKYRPYQMKFIGVAP